MTINNKTTILKALQAAGGSMPGPALFQIVRSMKPQATITEIRLSMEALEEDGFLVATRNRVSDLVTYGLTDQGANEAAKL